MSNLHRTQRGPEVTYSEMAEAIGDSLVRAIATSAMLGHTSVATTIRDYGHGPRTTADELVARVLTGTSTADLVDEWPWISDVGAAHRTNAGLVPRWER